MSESEFTWRSSKLNPPIVFLLQRVPAKCRRVSAQLLVPFKRNFRDRGIGISAVVN